MAKTTRGPKNMGTGIHVHQQFNAKDLVKGDTFFDADFGSMKWNGKKWKQVEEEETKKEAAPVKNFPNGFTAWQETHFEVVAAINTAWNKMFDEAEGNRLPENRIAAIQTQQGHGGLYELAEELTDQFELKNKGREWDGEFFDEIEEFLQIELNKLP